MLELGILSGENTKKTRPEVQQLFSSIQVGEDSRSVSRKIEIVLQTVSAKVCPTKMKLNYEEVGARMGLYPKDITFYACGRCGYLHAGHNPDWVDKAKSLMQAPEYRQIQHEKSVKKQKSKLKPPPKMK